MPNESFALMYGYVNGSNICVPIQDYLLYYRRPPDYASYPVAQALTWAIYAIIFSLGLFGNLCVIISICRFPTLRNTRNIFIGSLSASDICVALFSLPASAYTLIYKEWIFGDVLCRTIPIIQGVGLIISGLTLSAIAVDRYRMIVQSRLTPFTSSFAFKMNAVIWLTAIVVCIPPSYHSSLIRIPFRFTLYCGAFCSEYWSRPKLRKAYGLAVMTAQFVVPLVTSGFCYSRIAYILNHRLVVKQARQAGTKASKRQLEALRKTQRANAMFVLMVLTFSGCWFFRVLLNILDDFDATPHLLIDHRYMAINISYIVGVSSTIWNPIFYAFLNEAFQQAFASICPKIFHRKNNLGESVPVSAEPIPLLNGNQESTRRTNCDQI